MKKQYSVEFEIEKIMDLCGQKIVGLSMSERITTELVINALDDAYNRAERPIQL